MTIEVVSIVLHYYLWAVICSALEFSSIFRIIFHRYECYAMLKPQEKISLIINQLLDLISSGGDLGHHEFTIFRDIRQLDHNLDETDLAFALFHFCKRNIAEADRFFNRAIRNNNLICIGNYITFLMHIGEIRKAISIKNRYKSILLSSQDSRGIKTLSDVALCEGDFSSIQIYLKEARSRGDTYKEIVSVLENIIQGYELFKQISDLTHDQIIFLFNEMIDIFEYFSFGYLETIQFEINIPHDINAVSVVLNTDDIDKLIDANFELAERIAQQDQFIGKKFVACFELYNDDMNSLEDELLCQ